MKASVSPQLCSHSLTQTSTYSSARSLTWSRLEASAEVEDEMPPDRCCISARATLSTHRERGRAFSLSRQLSPALVRVLDGKRAHGRSGRGFACRRLGPSKNMPPPGASGGRGLVRGAGVLSQSGA